MEMTDAPPVIKAGLFTKLLLRIAAVNEDTLRLCPSQDWDNVKAVAEIMIFTWLYQTALFATIGHRLFAVPGQIRPELVLIAMFIATFILLIDSYMVMRSGWHLSGIEELKRGGLDISGGPAARIKAGLFMTIRIVLAIGIAQLTAVFLSIIVFAADIDARIHSVYLQANAHLLPAATGLVDDEIKRATEAVKAETAREATLSGQVSALRQNQIDPVAGDPQLQLVQQEVSQLLAEKAKADADVRAAETFASDELAGIKGASGNSGQVGDGPRRRAALEQLANARNQAQQTGSALAAAQGRLEAARKQAGNAGASASQRSQGQLPGLQNTLDAETAKLTGMRDQLASLTRDRADAITAAVDKAPDHVGVDNGLLAQITTLEHIAQDDGKIALVILLIDLTSFGFELASVLAKVTSFVPMTYAALLARDAYLAAVQIVDGMMAKLSPRTGGPDAGPPESVPDDLPPDRPIQGGTSGLFPPLPPELLDAANPPAPRPRGRPCSPRPPRRCRSSART
jgi:hypothetical protein